VVWYHTVYRTGLRIVPSQHSGIATRVPHKEQYHDMTDHWHAVLLVYCHIHGGEWRHNSNSSDGPLLQMHTTALCYRQ
jgi:hypothetical protein